MSTDCCVDDAMDQLMRRVSDPTWVEQFLRIEPGSVAAAAFLGRLIGPGVAIDPAAPLACWAGLGNTTTCAWIEPDTPGSLYAQWLTVCALTGATPAAVGRDMYAQWLALAGADPENTSLHDGDTRRQGDT